MKKFKLYFSVLASTFLMLVTIAPGVHAFDKLDGDMTYDEGAEVYVESAEDVVINQEKELEIKMSKMARIPIDSIHYTVAVPVYQQQNGYYCGPATVKQVLHYINGSSSSQSTYAKRLGTTTAGTDMTKIAPLLKSDTGKNYVYASIGSFDRWSDIVESSCRNKMPAIMDINTNSVSAFPYRTSGHFVNTSGISSTSGTLKVRITDPYGPGLGNVWYRITDVYNANNNHFRKAIIW